jgi:hypothetical protein
MAHQDQIAVLREGARAWNLWRRNHVSGAPDLSKANLEGVDLRSVNLRLAHLGGGRLAGADLRDADLRGAFLGRTVLDGSNLERANLKGATLIEATLDRANLRHANLRHTNMRRARLIGADLVNADLTGANLHQTDFALANLYGTNLTSARLVETCFRRCRLEYCCVYGISAWRLDVAEAIQHDLVMTPAGEATITVDDIEVAQFLHLILDNGTLRSCIDTIASKLVLLLGRFSAERKPTLDALRALLRKQGLIPVVFDFRKPARRDLTETVSLLAHMAKMVVVDITDPRCVPHELMSIVRALPSVLVQPVLHVSDPAYPMFEHLERFPWVRPVLKYERLEDLTSGVIAVLRQESVRPTRAES